MGNVLIVTVRDRLQDLFGYVGRFLLAQRFTIVNFFVKLAAVAKFGYQKQGRFVFVNFEKPNNVWMVQVFKDVDFVFEPDALLMI